MKATPTNDGDAGGDVAARLEAATLQPLALRAPEAARILGIGERSLWTLTRSGEIPHVKVGRATIYPVEPLRNWLAARAKKSIRRRGRGNSK